MAKNPVGSKAKTSPNTTKQEVAKKLKGVQALPSASKAVPKNKNISKTK